MKAIVVYESHWGNTATIARAIAEGIGPEARALSTAEATGEAIAGADLIVAGAPLLGFSLPTESMVKGLASNIGGNPTPDLSHPSMRSWLEALPKGAGRAAGFETRHLVVSRQRGKDDPGQAGGRGLPAGRQAPSVSSCRASTVRCATANWSGRRPGVLSLRRQKAKYHEQRHSTSGR